MNVAHAGHSCTPGWARFGQAHREAGLTESCCSHYKSMHLASLHTQITSFVDSDTAPSALRGKTVELWGKADGSEWAYASSDPMFYSSHREKIPWCSFPGQQRGKGKAKSRCSGTSFQDGLVCSFHSLVQMKVLEHVFIANAGFAPIDVCAPMQFWPGKPSWPFWVSKDYRTRYSLQFTHRPPCFNGVIQTSGQNNDICSFQRKMAGSGWDVWNVCRLWLA